ncbi:MAG: AAA family ATPase [Myxococcales bacterium]|nr:AAA family ATPase [Myxococcales bacterium]
MLLRFGVENFRSFRDPVELSLVGTRFKDAPDHRFSLGGLKHGVLPVAAIYGGNASGKSNLLAAIETMRAEVVGSFVDRKPGGKMRFSPFKLGDAAETPLTSFDIDFAVDGVRYSYGFRYDATRVHEEWLYAFPEGYQQVWFHRNIAEDDPFYFGPNLLGRKQTIADLTRPNSLLLSAAAQNNHRQLTPIYAWFAQRCAFSNSLMGRRFPVFREDSAILAPGRAALVRDLLARADVGVSDFRSRDIPLPPADSLRGLAPDVHEEVIAEISRSKALELGHVGPDGEPIYLNPSEESQGTHMLLMHMNVILEVLQKGVLLVLDELDASLHPRLSAALVAMFTDPESNPNGAQLVFSTHDETLINSVRRDSVVFVQKDRVGNSTVIPLAEFKTRARDDLRRAYHEGRLGGTPVVGDLAAAIARHRVE